MRDAKQNIGLDLKGLAPDQNVCSGGKQKVSVQYRVCTYKDHKVTTNICVFCSPRLFKNHVCCFFLSSVMFVFDIDYFCYHLL